MAYIERIAYRHLHAIRSQVVETLGMVFKAMLHFDLAEWLDQSAPELATVLAATKVNPPLFVKHDHRDGHGVQNYAMLMNLCLMNYEAGKAEDGGMMDDYFRHSIRSTSMSDHAEEDYYGSKLGGVWDMESFVIRGGVVLSLGAFEEFERGALRILCARVPNLKTGAKKQKLFYPRLRDYLQTSSAWDRAESSRKTQTVGGRRELFRQLGINTDPNSDWNSRVKKMRQDRNTIAHGEEAVRHSFQLFLQLHYDLFVAVRSISLQAQLLHRIVL